MENNIMEEGVVGNLDMFLPDIVDEYEDYVYLGKNKYVTMYGVLTFPAYVHVGYFDEIINEMGPKVQCTSLFQRIKNSEAIAQLSSQIVVMRSNIANDRNPDAGIVQKIADYEEMRKSIQLNQDIMLQVVRLYKIFGSSKEDLDKNCEIFQNICDQVGMIVKCLVLDQGEAFKSSLGTMYMGFNEKKFKKNIDTGAFVSMFAHGHSGHMHSKGIYLGTIANTGARLIYDIFIGAPYLSNPMMMIFGIPGAGKSVLLKLIAARSNATTGDEVVYFDVENEAEKLIKKLGGNYINLEAGKKSGINPLDIVISEDKGTRFIDLSGKIASVKNMLNLVAAMFGAPNGLNGKEYTVVELVLSSMFESLGITEDPDSLYEYSEDIKEANSGFNVGKTKKKMFVLSDLKAELYKHDATKDLALLMENITGKASMSMFDCQTDESIQLDRRVTGYGYKKIRDKRTKAFALINVMESVLTRFMDYRYKDIFKRLIVDESWDLLKYKELLEYIEEANRRGRKYDVSVILSTHFVDELLASKEGKAILKIAATKIIMQQNIDSVEDIAEYFNFSDELKMGLSMFESGDAIMVSGNEKLKFNVEVFDYEWGFVSTSNTDNHKGGNVEG
jgi:type IV secretory pathway VirB4 component